MNVALLASGKGSNVENILCYFRNHPKIKIALVGSNNSKSGALTHANNYSVPTLEFSKKELDTSITLLSTLNNHDIDLIVLAGFLLKIPQSFIHSFNGKIVNIHPSLLPRYGGKGMYGDHVHNAVLRNKEKKTGITFHYVNENYDEGKIIAQFTVFLDENETLSSLKGKISQLEWSKYPLIIERLSNE